MKKNNIKKTIIFIIFIVLVVVIPASVYTYNYNKYKNEYSKAMAQLNDEKYDESISTFNNILSTYFGKKNGKSIKENIEKAKKFKENKKTYDEALNLFNEKKYLEAIEKFKMISKEDIKRFNLANKRIDECKNQYISLNLENAKNEAKTSKFDSAINYLALVLSIDSANKDAFTLKDEYTKAKVEAEEKAKQEAIAKAKKEAEEKAKQVASQSVQVSKYPKVVCENENGIIIYQNESQEKQSFSGEIRIMFGPGGIFFAPQPDGFWYNLGKLGPGPEFEYTIKFKYNGTEESVKGVTGGTGFHFFSPNNIETGIVGTAEITITYNGKAYTFIKSFRK